MSEIRPSPPKDLLLLRELTHRVNNELASIINTISLAAARSPHIETKAALSEVMEVLHRHADVHRALKMPTLDAKTDAAEYLRELCAAMRRSKLEPMGIALSLNSLPLTLPSERTWQLGLIVYELVTNAARHAFSGGRTGEIRVELKRVGTFVQCQVKDNGFALRNMRPGQGLKIVKQLADDLGGSVQHRFEPDGSTSILVFPLNAVGAQTRVAARRTQPKFLAPATLSGSRPTCQSPPVTPDFSSPEFC